VAVRALRLIDFKNPRGFDDGGFFLSLGKTLGAVAVDVHAREPFSVVIKHGHLPVLVLPSSITVHTVRFLRSFLFHDEFFLGTSHYCKFTGDAQVTN